MHCTLQGYNAAIIAYGQVGSSAKALTRESPATEKAVLAFYQCLQHLDILKLLTCCCSEPFVSLGNSNCL